MIYILWALLWAVLPPAEPAGSVSRRQNPVTKHGTCSPRSWRFPFSLRVTKIKDVRGAALAWMLITSSSSSETRCKSLWALAVPKNERGLGRDLLGWFSVHWSKVPPAAGERRRESTDGLPRGQNRDVAAQHLNEPDGVCGVCSRLHRLCRWVRIRSVWQSWGTGSARPGPAGPGLTNLAQQITSTIPLVVLPSLQKHQTHLLSTEPWKIWLSSVSISWSRVYWSWFWTEKSQEDSMRK